MLEWLCDNYQGELHVSTGMTTKNEIEELISFFESKGRNKDLVLYNCTSGYPVPFEDVCLLEISRLIEKYAHRIKENWIFWSSLRDSCRYGSLHFRSNMDRASLHLG